MAVEPALEVPIQPLLFETIGRINSVLPRENIHGEARYGLTFGNNYQIQPSPSSEGVWHNYQLRLEETEVWTLASAAINRNLRITSNNPAFFKSGELNPQLVGDSSTSPNSHSKR